jgi:L-threonylcarbamoyladenylate synthase
VILDGGACPIGVESTIVDLSAGVVRLLRPGSIDREQLEAVLGQQLEHDVALAPRVSGSLKSHYAPSTPLSLVHSKDLLATVEVARSFARVAVMALQPAPAGSDAAWIQMPADSRLYAQHLYSVLRDLDRLGLDRLLVEAVPEAAQWAAVSDRLSRAAA